VKRTIFFVLVTALGFAAAARATDFRSIESKFTRECNAGEFAGVVPVRAHGTTILEKECREADIINHVPITRNTRFRIHSTSKLITALVIMRLVEQNRIALDGPLAEYVPDIPKEWKPVTIRSLLDHTSGSAEYTELLLYHFRADHPSAMRLTLSALTSEQRALKSRPGERFDYNKFGFELLADATAHATGEPFIRLVQEHVFTPPESRMQACKNRQSSMGIRWERVKPEWLLASVSPRASACDQFDGRRRD